MRRPLGSDMPEGVRFIGMMPGVGPAWKDADHPTEDDIATCVGCGLCLPHCPTYRLTQEESASPRGRIAAMRAIDEGRAQVDETFMRFTDLCLACRACEEVCPSHVPFGRMIESARVQTESIRKRTFIRSLALGHVIKHNWMLDLMAAATPLVRPFLPQRMKRLVPKSRARLVLTRLPRIVEPAGEVKGTVTLLRGCVQDRWFREVNEATIRVLSRNGWRVSVPKQQICCGALSAHHGKIDAAREMAAVNTRILDGDFIITNAAGCGAHMKGYGGLMDENPDATAFSAKVRDLMEFLAEQGIEAPRGDPGVGRVAYHDACHASRAQGIRSQPRDILARIPGLQVVEIADDGACCGAAGLYNVLEPKPASELGARKAAAIASTGVRLVASANPGCIMQISAYLGGVQVLHPIELLDRAYQAERTSL